MPGISLMDLTVAQTEAIELDLGLPVNRWKEAPSLARLLAKVAAAATGEDEEKFRAMKLGQLTDLVTLEDGDPNPTPPSEP
jgi:hypothetical protein